MLCARQFFSRKGIGGKYVLIYVDFSLCQLDCHHLALMELPVGVLCRPGKQVL